MILIGLILITSAIDLSRQEYLKLPENSPCSDAAGVQGICKRFERCSSAEFAVKSGKRPNICGFNGRQPVICCPNDDAVEPLSTGNQQDKSNVDDKTKLESYTRAANIARQKCMEYAKSVKIEIESPILLEPNPSVEVVDTCAITEEALVIGGLQANPREFPHMALIGYGEKDPVFLCGGSLISTRFVLSAAHCSDLGGVGPALWVKLGELDTESERDDADPKIFKIVRRIDHSQYDPLSFYNDITLFELDREVEISPYIRPICLNIKDNIPQQNAIATGWGHTSWGGPPSATLMKVKLALVSHRVCNRMYNKTRTRPQGILEEYMLCAGNEVDKDTCQGDSGGPLQTILKQPYCMYNQLGITSIGGKCGNGRPAIYTRVSNYVPWIVENVWPQ